ncbi:MAG: cytochrome c biogenesis protein CcsA [Armatimonadetes bacterium]|nr:cytochrome c biogenesis protein CcsA [Armatimonadota bacterium]
MAFLAMAALTVAAFLVPPAKGFPEPDLARIIFFHLPCAFSTVIFVLFAAYCSWRYLATRQMVWDFRAAAASEISCGVGVATMLTGILFSKVQWGDWWSWDPRQTSFLIVLFLLGAYFGIRMHFEDDILRARVAAAYSTLMLLPILFLFFVFPRLPQVLKVSLHPSTTVQTGAFTNDYKAVLVSIFVVLLAMCIWIYKMHVRTSQLEQLLKDRHGNLENYSDGTTAHRVDRNVPVH